MMAEIKFRSSPALQHSISRVPRPSIPFYLTMPFYPTSPYTSARVCVLMNICVNTLNTSSILNSFFMNFTYEKTSKLFSVQIDKCVKKCFNREGLLFDISNVTSHLLEVNHDSLANNNIVRSSVYIFSVVSIREIRLILSGQRPLVQYRC